MNIILLAPPAAGKGTQAELLKETYQINHISTGNLLREVSQEESDFGKKIKAVLESGSLVSDDIVLAILERYLDQIDCSHLLLDGFPRNLYQAEKLDDMLAKKNSQIDFVIELDVPYSILLDRITGRRLCKSCGKSYNMNIDSLKPKIEGICDSCGNELYTRSDDNQETFQVRYQEYFEKTQPLIDYYQKQGKLKVVDGTLSKEEIFSKIQAILGKR